MHCCCVGLVALAADNSDKENTIRNYTLWGLSGRIGGDKDKVYIAGGQGYNK